jgi:hypothetical protein
LTKAQEADMTTKVKHAITLFFDNRSAEVLFFPTLKAMGEAFHAIAKGMAGSGETIWMNTSTGFVAIKAGSLTMARAGNTEQEFRRQAALVRIWNEAFAEENPIAFSNASDPDFDEVKTH